jgi:hypothetical protein
MGDQTDPYYATYGFIKNVLTKNDAAAKNPKSTPYLALAKYNKDSMIQPDISGLYNPYFYQAAYDFGIRYIISDTSRKPPKYADDWNNTSPNAGYYVVAKFVTDANGNQQYNSDGSPQVQITRSQTPLPPPALLVIPRHPTNLFYNLRTPAQWVSEYNCFYSKASANSGLAPCANGEFLFWDNDLSYNQILDQESKLMLEYLLKWDLDPLMFHQPNVGIYQNGKSLLGDLIDTTLGKYNSMYTLPILTLSQHDLGIRMANRMAFNQSGVTALLYPCGKVASPNITVTTVNAARIPVTGVSYGTNQETYGGQSISYVDLPAGGSVSIPITCP